MPMPRPSQPSRRRRQCLAALAALPWLAARAAGPTPRAWPAGQPTPALALPAFEGPAQDTAALRGQVLLLNFWASWCEPCRAEMPSLELLAERHARDRLQVLAINYRETDAAIRRYLDLLPMSLTILRDRDGAAARAFGARVFPTTVAIGRDGRAAFSVTGEVDWTGADARRWVAALL